MDADQPARAEPRRPGLAAEAGRVGDEILRQVAGREDFLAVEIRDRDLGRGREEEFVALAAVELLLEFRQLAGADERLAANDERRADLRVAVLARVQVEHEVDQRPLQPRPRAGIAGEGAAAHPRGAFEVEKAKLRADLDVAARRGNGRLFPPCADDWICRRRPRRRERPGGAGSAFGAGGRAAWPPPRSVSWLSRAMSSPMARTWLSRSAVSSPRPRRMPISLEMRFRPAFNCWRRVSSERRSASDSRISSTSAAAVAAARGEALLDVVRFLPNETDIQHAET